MSHLKLTACALLLFLSGCATRTGRGPGQPASESVIGQVKETVLIEDGRRRCTIVLAGPDAAALRITAEDLAHHLYRMSGAKVPIVTDPSQAAGVPIYIGTLPDGLTVPVDLGDQSMFWPDGYLLMADGKQVILAAPRTEGVRNAVYGLLEDHLGCHWFTPGRIGEHIPARPTVKLGLEKGYEVVKPGMELRIPWYSSPRPLGPSLEDKSRAESIDMDLWYKRNRAGGIRAYYYHNWYRIYTPELLKKEPELACFRDGKRRPEVTAHRYQACLSNPRAVDVAAEYFIQYFRENPAVDYASFSDNDGNRHCECDPCKAMGNVATRIVTVANRVLERVNEVHPGKGLCFLVYGNAFEAPERKLAINPNLAGVICSANGNNKPWMDQIRPKTENHPDAVAYRQNVERWMSMLSKAWTYDYYGWFPGPYTMFGKLAGERAYYTGLGISGDGSEYMNRELGTDTLMWLTIRAGWGRSVDELLDAFYADYFGAAAADMRSVYEGIEEHMRTAAKHGTYEVALDNSLDLYPPRVITGALDKLAAATEKVIGDELRLARVRRDGRCLSVTRLFMAAYASIRSYYDRGNPADRRRAVAASDTYVRLHRDWGIPMPEAAAVMLSPFVFTGPGPFDVNDYMRRSDGRTWRAREFVGFTRGEWGLDLAPGARGEIVYELKAAGELKIRAMKCRVWNKGKLTLHVSIDNGETWLFPARDKEGMFELTGLLAGRSRFLLRLAIENDTGEQTCVLERWRLTGDVE